MNEACNIVCSAIITIVLCGIIFLACVGGVVLVKAQGNLDVNHITKIECKKKGT